MKYKGKAWIKDEKVNCASQMCPGCSKNNKNICVPAVIEPIEENPRQKYWENICKIQKSQTDKGIEKYGQVLEENLKMNMQERLRYLEEELIDGLMYIEHIKTLLGIEQEQ